MYKTTAILLKSAYDVIDRAQEIIAKMIPEDDKMIIKLKELKHHVWSVLTEIDPGGQV